MAVKLVFRKPYKTIIMNKFSLSLLSLFFIIQSFGSLQAQEDDDIKTLFRSDMELSAMAGYSGNFTSLKGDPIFSQGWQVAVILDKKFYAGAFWYKNASSINNVLTRSVDMGFGGINMGYIIKPSNAIHFYGDVKYGWGKLDFNANYNNNTSDGLIMLLPSIGLEANLLKWLRLNAGLGYQFISGSNNIYYSNDELSSPSVQIGARFGWFN